LASKRSTKERARPLIRAYSPKVGKSPFDWDCVVGPGDFGQLLFANDLVARCGGFCHFEHQKKFSAYAAPTFDNRHPEWRALRIPNKRKATNEAIATTIGTGSAACIAREWNRTSGTENCA
jgi:hypothetical protein